EFEDLPIADVVAYSMDDSFTFEVDDALSVTMIGDEIMRLGIHIAAPGLAIERDSELDRMARSRMSTVYRSEEHTSELQSRENLVCRLLLEKKKQTKVR